MSERAIRLTKVSAPSERRAFIGGSDARIIMGNDEDALISAVAREARRGGTARLFRQPARSVAPVAARRVLPNVVAEEHLGATQGVGLQREIGIGVARKREHRHTIFEYRHRVAGRQERDVARRNVREVEHVADTETGHRDGRGGRLIKFERAHARERDGNGRARVDGIVEIDEPATLDIDSYRAVDT